MAVVDAAAEDAAVAADVAAVRDAAVAAPSARRLANDRVAVPDAAAAVAADMLVDAAVTDAAAAVAEVLTAPIAALANAELGPFLRKLPVEDVNIRSFEALLATGKPRCGQVRDTQRDFLFGPESPSIGSVALVPLGENGSVGLLALGSAERERFHPGMSTEFLKRMGELITDALSRT